MDSDDEFDYYAYTVSYHPSSPLHEESRYRLLYSPKELPTHFTGLSEGHLYFPKIVSVGKLTTAHIELFQTCVDKTSSDSELREEAACDMDVWSFSFNFHSEGSKRMNEEGAYSAYYKPESDYMLLAFPLWEVYSIPAAENSIDEDILVVKTYSKEHQSVLLEVVYPFQLIAGEPREIYHFHQNFTFTFGSMRFVRKFIPHRQEVEGLTLRDCVMIDAENAKTGICLHAADEVCITDGIEQLRRFTAKRDEALEEHFPQQKFETRYWEKQRSGTEV